MQSLRALGGTLLDYLYPPCCLTCGNLGEPFCTECRSRISPYDPGVPAPASLSAVRSVGLHEEPLKRAVIRLKFHRKVALVPPLGALLAAELAAVRAEWQPDLLVPIPIHPGRRRERGFNQSELLAQQLTLHAGVPTVPALVRTRATSPQLGKSALERKTNLVGAFDADPRYSVDNCRVVLIDDVWTTGSTLREGALTLHNAGAAAVFALTVTYDV